MTWTEALFGWDQGLTLLAPIVAIGAALATRRVAPSLALGVVVAAVVGARGRLLGDGGWVEPAACLVGPPCAEDGGTWLPEGVCTAAADLASSCEAPGALGLGARSLGEALLGADNLTIATFTALVAAMVAVMGAAGLTARLVHAVDRVARGPRGAMIASWLAGFVVFFDDYANCLVVGSSMGPVCDRHGVSRAKLSYIVDSTAAPVASLTIVGTWVGYEVGLLDEALADLGTSWTGFGLFVASLPYAFYGIFALALVGIVAATGRDLGPMLDEEIEARRHHAEHGGPSVDGAFAGSVAWAAAPVVVLIALTFAWMWHTGTEALGDDLAGAPLYEILGSADPYGAMLLGALAAFLTAAGIATGRAGLGGRDLGGATWSGVRGVLEALLVLYMAWTIGNAIGATEARAFLLSALGDWFPAMALPTATFVVASAVAFATGTSFGTMSILVPLAVPLAVDLGGDVTGVLLGTTAAVLGGAIFGDHASPISDTTVLSATGAKVDLVTHVRTQLPYALLAAAVAVVVGFLPAGLGLSPWPCLVVGIGLLYVVMRAAGRVPEAQPVSGS